MRAGRYFKRPIIGLFVSLAAGIAAGDAFSRCSVIFAFFAVTTFFYLFVRLVKDEPVEKSPFLLFFFIGHLSIQPWISPDLPANHVSKYADGKRYLVSGRVAAPVVYDRKRMMLLVSAKRLAKPGSDSFIRVSGLIRMTIGGLGPDIRKNDEIEAVVVLRTPRNYRNPNAFDYKRYLAFKRVHATAYIDGKSALSIRIKRKGFSPVERTRARLRAIIDSATDKYELSSVARAFLLGEKRAVPKSIRDDFADAGVSHLLAISGLHMGMVAGVFFLLLSRIFIRGSFLGASGTGRRIAGLVSILPVLGYGALTGWSPSTQRAAIMICLFLAALVLKRSYDVLNILGAAGLFILIVDPPALFSVSFQLSFAAVTGILVGMHLFKRHFQSRESLSIKALLLSRIKLLFFVTAFAMAGTAPLSVHYFHSFSLIGLVANMVVVPFVSFVILPAGLLAGAAAFAGKILLSGLVSFYLKATGLLIGLVGFFASFSLSSVRLFTISWIEVFLIYAIAGCLAYLADSCRRRGLSLLTGKNRRVSAFLLIAVLLLSVDSAWWIYRRRFHGDMRVTFLDVRHGNAALVEFPKGLVALIDGGGARSNDIFDVGRYVVAPYLWDNKIMKVDYVILTHPDADHVNGLVYILDNFKIGEVWCLGDIKETAGVMDFFRVIRERGIRMPDYDSIRKKREISGALIELLYPSDLNDAASTSDMNGRSIVLRMSFNTYSMLFPGDITAGIERLLVKRFGSGLASDLLLAPHHGSRSSSSNGFIAAVQPKVVIFSSGGRLPNPSVVSRYKRIGANPLKTSDHGAVLLRLTEKVAEYRTFSGEKYEFPLIDKKRRID